MNRPISEKRVDFTPVSFADWYSEDLDGLVKAFTAANDGPGSSAAITCRQADNYRDIVICNAGRDRWAVLFTDDGDYEGKWSDAPFSVFHFTDPFSVIDADSIPENDAERHATAAAAFTSACAWIGCPITMEAIVTPNP